MSLEDYSAAEATPAPPALSRRPPGARETLGRGLDLSLASSRDVRRASLYIGLLTLLSLGPVAAAIAAVSVNLGGLDWMVFLLSGDSSVLRPIPVGALAFAEIAVIAGGICFAALAFDAQLIALAVVGGRAAGWPISLRRAIRIARARFWRLVWASTFVGLILLLPRRVAENAANNVFGPRTEAAGLATTAIDAFLLAPFVYVGAAVVLAQVNPQEAVRRSIGMARARWRLALLERLQ